MKSQKLKNISIEELLKRNEFTTPPITVEHHCCGRPPDKCEITNG